MGQKHVKDFFFPICEDVQEVLFTTYLSCCKPRWQGRQKSFCQTFICEFWNAEHDELCTYKHLWHRSKTKACESYKTHLVAFTYVKMLTRKLYIFL